MDLDLAAGFVERTRDDFEQGTLACAIAPNQPYYLTTLDLEGDIAQRPERRMARFRAEKLPKHVCWFVIDLEHLR